MEGKELDSCLDIYSLGVMMYEMLMGEMFLFLDNFFFGGWYEVYYYIKFYFFFVCYKIFVFFEVLVMNCLVKSFKGCF